MGKVTKEKQHRAMCVILVVLAATALIYSTNFKIVNGNLM